MENSPIDLPFFYTSSCADETIALGKRLALSLEKGSIVSLDGTLGAGKTCFAKGIARGLGINDEVTSPTYTIVSQYDGFLSGGEQIPVYHIDVYRLTGSDDFSAIGGEELVFGKGVSIIEWGGRIPDFIPAYAIKVNIEIKTDSSPEAGARFIHIYREEPPKEGGCK